MGLRKALQSALARYFGLAVYSTAPHGRDDCHDLLASGHPIETIVDVGANDGSSAMKFHRAFPDAVIHCLEPVTRVHAELVRNVSGVRQIHCHRVAAGAAEGEATIYLTDHSTTSSLVRPATVRGEERIEVTTLDAFAKRQSLAAIDLLKIDAEGFDLEVVRGAAGLLARDAVRFILIEVGFDPAVTGHVPFERELLAAQGFTLYGIYDQQLEWSGENRLRYANACFAHRSVLEARRRKSSTR